MPIRIILLFCILGITACSTTRLSEQDIKLAEHRWTKILNTDRLKDSVDPSGAEKTDIFELPDHVVAYLNEYIVTIESSEKRYLELRDWIYDQFRMHNYDFASTATANELFNTRNINCLSFSILFVAAARHVNLPVQLQVVHSPPYWDLNEKTSIRNLHVNVATNLDLTSKGYYEYSNLDAAILASSSGRGGNRWIKDTFSFRKITHVMDLNPSIVNVSYKTEALDDDQAYALYYSNKSIESLFKEDIRSALKHSKYALEHDLLSSTAWNNLGVLLKRSGELSLAKLAFDTAIVIDRDNFPAKINLSATLSEMGEFALAEKLEKEVEGYRNSNPYYYYALSEDAYSKGRLNSAIEQLEKAVQLKFDEPQFYFSLARCYAKLGDRENTQANLILARNHAKTGEKARFTTKLNNLNLASSP